MSAISGISAGSSAASGLPVVNQATEPTAVRDGGAAAQKAYQTGLAFEQMLVSQMTQAMSSTLSGDGSNSDGLGGTSDSSDGSSGSSGSPLGAYSSLLPQAMTTGIMSTGGTGVALQIAESLDPSLRTAVAQGTGSAAASTAMTTPQSTGPGSGGAGA